MIGSFRHDVASAGLAAAIAAAVVALSGASVAAQTYGLATMQPGTLNHTTGSAIAKVLKEKAGMNALVQPTAGESVLIPLVGRGEAELGIANALEVAVGVEGARVPELRLIGATSKARKSCSDFQPRGCSTRCRERSWRRAG